MNIKIFGDGADMNTILELYKNPIIRGFTTNPTLMRKAGIKNYEAFAKDLLTAVPDRPISFEVFADDFIEMSRQATKIANWGPNVYVKIPIMNTEHKKTYELIHSLSHAGIKVNVTAVMTTYQVMHASDALADGAPAYISVFAGRIADTGVDPIPCMKDATRWLMGYPNVELIWASPRELLNIFQADEVGCHIITATNDILKKLPLIGKNLYDFSHETVQMFFDDAKASEFTL